MSFFVSLFGVAPPTPWDFPPFVARVAALALGAVLTLPAHAGRPLATDDAAIVEAGACQFEAWREYARDAHATWLNPGCNPFGSTEFSLGRARIHTDDTARLDLWQWQVKQMLRAYDDTRPGFALALGGQRMRGGDARELFLNGIATVPLAGEAQLIHLNLGGLRLHADGQHSHRATWGVAYDAEVAMATRASLEGFGVSGERSRWQLGLRHELMPGRVQLDASLGSAFGRWNEDRVWTLGMVWVSPAFLR